MKLMIPVLLFVLINTSCSHQHLSSIATENGGGATTTSEGGNAGGNQPEPGQLSKKPDNIDLNKPVDVNIAPVDTFNRPKRFSNINTK